MRRRDNLESALVGCLGYNRAELVRMPCDPSARNMIIAGCWVFPLAGLFQESFPDAMMQVIAEHPIIFQAWYGVVRRKKLRPWKWETDKKILTWKTSSAAYIRVRFFCSGRGGNTRFSLDYMFIWAQNCSPTLSCRVSLSGKTTHHEISGNQLIIFE